MNIKKIFKEQGGFSLLKNYWRTGALLPAIITFIVLGKSKKALEILRLVAQFKTNQKIYKLYENRVDKLLDKYNNEENSKNKEQSAIMSENRSEKFMYPTLRLCWIQHTTFQIKLQALF